MLFTVRKSIREADFLTGQVKLSAILPFYTCALKGSPMILLSDLWPLLSQLILIGIVAFFVLVLLAFTALIFFWKTERMFIPKVMINMISIVESPIRTIMNLVHMDGRKLDYAIISVRNNMYLPAYARVPYKYRAIFIPQCLRNPNCPAKLSPEGLQCINCGQCGLGELKKFSEDLGCMFFIAPGGMFVKRMMLKYRPKAILGVGCSMELKEGLEMSAGVGMPAQGVLLKRDGCVDTRVDIERLMHAIALNEKEAGIGSSLKVLIADIKDNIQNMWTDNECPNPKK